MGCVHTVRWFAALLLTVVALMACAPQAASQVNTPPTASQAKVIPAVITGRATVYEWKCSNDMPEVVRQFAQPDARGFLSNIWYAISSTP